MLMFEVVRGFFEMVHLFFAGSLRKLSFRLSFVVVQLNKSYGHGNLRLVHHGHVWSDQRHVWSIQIRLNSKLKSWKIKNTLNFFSPIYLQYLIKYENPSSPSPIDQVPSPHSPSSIHMFTIKRPFFALKSPS
jgi:hypothetical protein